MTSAECEIVANAGVQLREIAQRLTIPAGRSFTNAGPQEVINLVYRMDAAAMSIAEVYGALSALPLENERTYGHYERVNADVVRWVPGEERSA